MFRLLGFFVRVILSLLMVALGIAFLGPYLVQCVDKWQGRVEEYPSFAEQFQVIDRVRGFFEGSEASEVGFSDLIGLMGAEGSDESEGSVTGESLKLTPTEVKALGDVYLKVTGGDEAKDSESTAGSRPSASGDLVPDDGL